MAFNTSISGLNAASADLNVVGNNIANSGTAGFKSSRTEFADVYPVGNVGSGSITIGSGVSIGAVAQQFTQGNISFTNNALDLAVSGQGFFRMSDNGAISYTRAGALHLDGQGYLTNSKDHHLTGFQAVNGVVTGALGDLQISTADIAPIATSSMTVGVNLNAAAGIPVPAFNPADPSSYNNATSTTIYDSLGNTHLASMYYRHTAANTWATYLYIDGAAVDGPDTLTFSATGALTAGSPIASPAYNPANGANNITLTLNYGSSTQFGSPFGVNSLSQNGNTTGRLSGVEVDADGVLIGRYTNGQTLAQGQVVLSNFSNVQGLQPLGDTSWGETSTSGAALVGAPKTASLGAVQSGGLEDSNVNLTEQLVKLIVAQRNFQANAQSITAENTITQTVINIR